MSPSKPPKTDRPTIVVLPRVAGRISFCFVDRAQIRRDEYGVVARVHSKEHGTENVELPVASFAALLIGPGTSITQPALSLTTRSGCAVVCMGTDGTGATAVALPQSQNAEWLEKQVKAWADPTERMVVARRLYKMRFDEDPGDLSIEQLRGLEGHRVKRAYRQLSTKHGVSFRRLYKKEDWDKTDPINRAISVGTHILYGLVQAAFVSIGVHPGLGFIHTGTQRSFVFDIADLYKLELVVPQAFLCHDSANPEADMRRRMRRSLKLLKLLHRIIPDVQHALDPSAPKGSASRPAPDPIRLWDPDIGVMPGGINYEGEPF